MVRLLLERVENPLNVLADDRNAPAKWHRPSISAHRDNEWRLPKNALTNCCRIYLSISLGDFYGQANSMKFSLKPMGTNRYTSTGQFCRKTGRFINEFSHRDLFYGSLHFTWDRTCTSQVHVKLCIYRIIKIHLSRQPEDECRSCHVCPLLLTHILISHDHVLF